LKSLPDDIRNRIKDKIKDILKEDPLPEGKDDIKKITGTKYWRIRVGEELLTFENLKQQNL